MAMIETPNLFKFATSELSQDAFLCWLFEHIRLKTNDIGYEVAESFLNKIFENYKNINSKFVISNIQDYNLKIEQQKYNIDILLTLESNIDSEKLYIIVEDKTNSGESRENQPEYYAAKIKVGDSKATIIPVLFKTGYIPVKEQKKLNDREIVLIGYEDIYDLFSKYSQSMKGNVILNSWWNHFYNNYYKPIESAKSLEINPDMTLKELNQKVKKNLYPEIIAFQKITDYLFENMAEEFLTKTYSVQGKGHIDWHFELSKTNWKCSNKKIAISLYFIWDTYDFSLVIKTSPLKYKPLKELTEDEKKGYIHSRETIKEEIKMLKQIDWKITNYYLQISQMNNIHGISIDQLKKKMEREIILIKNEIDRMMDKDF